MKEMDAKTYCLGCIHSEVCGWYPRIGCDRFHIVEPFSDEEQRIFLAAMGREKKYCKHIEELWDKLHLTSDDDIDLLKVCEEIERKVIIALFGKEADDGI